MDPNLACFRGKNEDVNERSFNVYLRKMRIINKSLDLSDIRKVELIANYENKIRTLYTFFSLEKCNDDQLTYIINIYSEILKILKDLKPQNDEELTEYKGYYKEVEDAYTKVREARKKIIVESITRAVNKSRSQSMFHIPNDMKMPPVIRQHEESVSVFDFAKSHKKSSNPLAKGNENKHKEFVKEQKAKKRSSVISPDGPPPPPPLHIVTPPKSSSTRSRSRSAKSSEGQRAVVTPPKEQRSRSSPNKLLDSRSLGRSLGMTAKRVSELSQRRRRGGKTRKHKKN